MVHCASSYSLPDSCIVCSSFDYFCAVVLLIYYTGASQLLLVLAEKRLVNIIKVVTKCIKAPVAQLDRALPSEGRGQRFESSRVRHNQPDLSSLTIDNLLITFSKIALP